VLLVSIAALVTGDLTTPLEIQEACVRAKRLFTTQPLFTE